MRNGSKQDAGVVYLSEHQYFMLLNQERLEQPSAAASRYTAQINDRIGWIAQMVFETLSAC